LPRICAITSRRSSPPRRSRSRRSATTSTPTVKKTETRIQFLEQPELEKLLDAPYPDDAFGRIEPTLYLTAEMTGLRQGELLGLRWRDVDVEARKIRGVSPYVRGEFGDPKSAGSGRSVPMADSRSASCGGAPTLSAGRRTFRVKRVTRACPPRVRRDD